MSVQRCADIFIDMGILLLEIVDALWSLVDQICTYIYESV